VKALLLGQFASLTGKGLKGQLVRAGAGGLGVRILALVLTLLSSVVLTRTLGVDNYGLYVFVLSITSLLAFPVQMGIPILLTRETARAEVKRDWVAFHSIRVWALRMNIVLGGIIVAGILAYVWIKGDDFSPETRLIYWLAAALIIPVGLAGTLGAVLRGLRRIVLGQLPTEVLRPLFIITLIASAWYFAPSTLTASSALVLNLVATMGVLMIAAAFLWRATPSESKGVRERVFDNMTWLRAILPLAMMSGLQLINQNVDLVMVGIFRSHAEVGQYKIAVSTAALVIFGLSAIQVVAMPYISGFFAEKDMIRLQRLAGTCAAASVVLALPVVLILGFWGKDLLAIIYGQSFVPAWEPMMILSIAQLVNGFFGIVWPLLVMTGHERNGVYGLLAASLLNVPLNALLIPPYGVAGAAIATGISIIVWNLLFWLAVHRKLGIDGSMLGLLRSVNKEHSA